MCNPLAWLSHFICAFSAINWGLAKFLRFNIVEYITIWLRIPYINEFLYITIALAGFYSLFSLFTVKTCK